MNFEKINEYCIENSTGELPLLKELRRETYLKTTRPGMISGPIQGQLLTLLVRMLKPKKVLEIGTFTGYASICIAEGLDEHGTLTSIEMDEELSYFHEKYFRLYSHGDKIRVLLGDANQILKNLQDNFDLAFIDAGKKDYLSQYEIVLNRMPSGGVILADNVLWKGKVVEQKKDSMTQNLHDFNQHVLNDDRVINLILPFRDGINMIIKR